MAQALLRSESHDEVAQQALDFLVANRDSGGSFYTTQATIQALKALLMAADEPEEDETATVTISYVQPDWRAGDADDCRGCEQRRCRAAGGV